MWFEFVKVPKPEDPIDLHYWYEANHCLVCHGYFSDLSNRHGRVTCSSCGDTGVSLV